MPKKTEPVLYDFPVANRWTGAVQFTTRIEAGPSALFGVRLGLAVKWALRNGANLRGADLSCANLSDADLFGADLSGADLSCANLSGAYLSDADLFGADLSGADLSCADLRGADLRDAYLSGADLSGAYLRGADLFGANLRGEKIARIFARIQREIDPYLFMGVELQAGGFNIAAGCRWFTADEFRAHVAQRYPHTDKAAETLAILDFIEARAAALGITKADHMATEGV
jgi:hypothetical protein